MENFRRNWVIVMMLIAINSLFVSGNHAFAEGYIPMLREGRVWEYRGFGGYRDGPDRQPTAVYHYLKLDGCEKLNGESYSRAVLFKTTIAEIHEDRSESILSTEDRDQTLYFLRESEGKVYVLKSEGGQLVDRVDSKPDNLSLYDVVVYDWTLEDGDPWRYGEVSGFSADECPKVMYGEPVQVGPDECRVMNFNTMAYVTFIEGIGVLANGSFGDYTFDIPVHLTPWINLDKPGIDSYLARVCDDGQLVYDAPVDYLNSVVSVGEEADLSEKVFYDLAGRAVTGKLSSGIYIHEGKKIMVR
jgi:hypothetical protein